MMVEPLARGSRIGIIGGGQLGRMLAMAAARMGYRCTIVDPQSHCPAGKVADQHIAAAYDNPDALKALAETCAVVTYEFENVSVAAAEQLSETVPVFPPPKALAISQDRATEKSFLADAGLQTAPWHPVSSESELQSALSALDGRGILKTRRLGYDGKGQVRFNGIATVPSIAEAMTMIGHAPAILEGFVDFAGEISVIATRGQDGSIRCYDPARNEHEDGILARSHVPAGVDDGVVERAQSMAADLLESLGYVGTLGLELFLTSDGKLLANEFAPRVHNSGHWTEAACTVSQFEQHIRAIAGWPLGDTARHSDCLMENVLGDAITRLPDIAGKPDVFVHDYGKAEPKPGRKMGHYTRLWPRKGR